MTTILFKIYGLSISHPAVAASPCILHFEYESDSYGAHTMLVINSRASRASIDMNDTDSHGSLFDAVNATSIL